MDLIFIIVKMLEEDYNQLLLIINNKLIYEKVLD